MSVQIRPSQAQPDQRLSSDRTTVIAVTAVGIALLILIGLIAFITLYPAQTINQSIVGQTGEEQRLFASSLARQLEGYFNGIANQLIGLAGRPELQSSASEDRDKVLALFNEIGTGSEGRIKAIVRLSANGTPAYAWPDQYNQLIVKNTPLPWTVDQAWMDSITAKREVQFVRRSVGGDVTYLLVTPMNGANAKEVLAVETTLNTFLDSSFGPLDVGQTGQIWVFDRFGNEIYHKRPEPVFNAGTAQILSMTEPTQLSKFPTDDRESVVAPVYTAFTQSRENVGSLVVVVSRTISEGQQTAASVLNTLFFVALAIIAVLVVSGLLIGRFLLRENANRHQEAQRRSVARTLLEMSRALNSSLDLNVVLQLILRELNNILPHDNASILLLSEEGTVANVAAVSGQYTPDDDRKEIPLAEVRGARAVTMMGRPIVINDCANDPRWKQVTGSLIRSWLGVPLRVRDEAVGVLNINSYEADRFVQDDIDLAEAFADQAGVAIQNARAHEMQIKVYEAELETARAIQTSLLPQEQPPVPQLQIAARAVPARHVSGDYHQYFPLPDGRLGIAVGDVSGKGIPAALLMAVITTTLRDEILRTPSPASLLNELNGRLLGRMQANKMNSALLVSIFDPVTRHIEIANGGMVQPYVRNGAGWEFVPVGGYPLGASGRTSYSAKTVTLAPDSMLLFLTDGVLESENLEGEFFGFERLEELLNSLPPSLSAEQIADAVLSAVRSHLEGQEPQDDITVVVLKSIEIG